MTPHRTPLTLKVMNFIVGVALLSMVSPLSGQITDQPAGVRTAIELIGKKPSLRAGELPVAQTA